MDKDRTELFIDIRNAIYRAAYAGAHNPHSVKYHDFVLLLRQIVSWIRQYSPCRVHVFWDTPRKNVWRKQILPSYKERRQDNKYIVDLSDRLDTISTVAIKLFGVMGVRQYYRDGMEADDLIYAATCVLHPKTIVIVSTDSDLIQIPYNFRSCTVYDPYKKSEVQIPILNPVMQKSLVGDKSDAIDGYHGIGPKKSANMLEDPALLCEFLNDKGPEIYKRNMSLIDLSLNPHSLDNKLYVQERLGKPVEFSKEKINKLILQHKINGMMQEFADLIPPFMDLT